MLDEGTLRERFPEIPWDQPVRVTVAAHLDGAATNYDMQRWCCRYCIALHGLRGEDVATRGHVTRQDCLNHIERVHHD